MILRYHPLYHVPCTGALLVALLIGAAVETVSAQVVINEVLASNRSNRLDEDGDSSDWLELYNAGSSVVDLTGYSLTDERSDPS